MMSNYLKLFFRFLKEEHIFYKFFLYKNYIKNTLKLDKVNDNDIEIINILIKSSFMWAETPEGYVFWSEKNKKWLKTLKENE